MTAELSRRLLALGVPRPELEAALFVSVVRGVAIARALIDRGVLTERVLEEDLARAQGFALEQVTAAEELTVRLPPAMCRRLGAIPIRLDAFANTAEIAAIDAQDPHIPAEFSFHLGLDVRVVRATMSAIEAEIRRLELGESTAAPARVRRRTPAFPHGAPRSSIPPPPMEEVPIPLVRRVGAPSNPGRPSSSRPGQPRGSSPGRNPTPPQFSFGAAHVRSALEGPALDPPPLETAAAAEPAAAMDRSRDRTSALDFEAATPPDGDTDLDAATIARTTGSRAARANGASERAPASARHTPRLLADAVALGAGPAVSFPSTPPSSVRKPSEPAPPPAAGIAQPRLPLADPALHALPPQSLVPSTELAPPRLPALALGPVTAHAVLEWGPASDAFARGVTTPISETDPPAPAHAREVGAPTLSAPSAAVDAEPPVTEPAPTLEARADEPTSPGVAAWEEHTDQGGYEEFPSGPHSDTRFIDRSPEDVLPEALDALSGALDRNELIATLIEVATMVAERVGVFVVKKDAFHGWSCNEGFGDVAALRAVRIPTKVPNILATAMAAGFYLGPVPNTPGHQELLAVMGSTGRDVSVNVATVAQRPVLVLVSDGFGDTLRTTKVLGEMMRVAGLTLARLLQMR